MNWNIVFGNLYRATWFITSAVLTVYFSRIDVNFGLAGWWFGLMIVWAWLLYTGRSRGI